MNLPLSGKTILNCRPEARAEELTSALEAQSAAVVKFPTIQIAQATTEEQQEIVHTLEELGEYSLTVLTSPSGIEQFMRLNTEQKRFPIAVIGSATKSAAEAHELQIVFCPSSANSETLAEELITFVADGNPPVVLLRAERATPELPRRLREAQIAVHDLVLYRSMIPESARNEAQSVAQKLGLMDEASSIHAITAMSSDTLLNLLAVFAEHAAELAPNWRERLNNVPLAVVGEKTAKTAEKLGFLDVRVALEPSAKGVALALVN